MPAKRANATDDAINLLQRYGFAGELMLMEIRHLHEIRQCCRAEPCRGMVALSASLDKIKREAEQVVDGLTKRRRRTATKRPQTGVAEAGGGATFIPANGQRIQRFDYPSGATEP